MSGRDRLFQPSNADDTASGQPRARDEGEIPAADLLGEFLLATRSLSLAEVARTAGVHPLTVRRWRRSGAQRLDQPVRRRLLLYMNARSARPSRAPRQGAIAAPGTRGAPGYSPR